LSTHKLKGRQATAFIRAPLSPAPQLISDDRSGS
jgi:hypothetical protein